MSDSRQVAKASSIAACETGEGAFQSRDQLRALQLQRLQAAVRRAYDNVDFVRRRLDQGAVGPDIIKRLEDLRSLPFTAKDDLRTTYPYGLFAVPLNDVVRLHASSGTTGKPIVVGYTANDIEVWTSVMARTLTACGVGADDIVQNAFGYGLFTGGLGVHYGAEGLGATVVPTSGGNTDRQITVLRDFGVTAICCTPSYFLHLVERAQQMGINLRQLPLRVGVFGAEPWTDAMRERIERATDIKAFDIYGLSEIIGPGVATECLEQRGLHVFEDHFLLEVVDPETLEAVPDGQEGELVLTTLSKEAMPLIRYRTGDITTLVSEPCPCGLLFQRIDRISRRADDMFIVRGVNVYPSQIESALLAVEGTLPYYQIVLSREQGLDQMEIQVEASASESGKKDIEQLHDVLSEKVKSTLGIRVDLTVLPPRSIPRSEGKAKRVVDNREL